MQRARNVQVDDLVCADTASSEECIDGHMYLGEGDIFEDFVDVLEGGQGQQALNQCE